MSLLPGFCVNVAMIFSSGCSIGITVTFCICDPVGEYVDGGIGGCDGVCGSTGIIVSFCVCDTVGEYVGGSIGEFVGVCCSVSINTTFCTGDCAGETIGSSVGESVTGTNVVLLLCCVSSTGNCSVVQLLFSAFCNTTSCCDGLARRVGSIQKL